MEPLPLSLLLVAALALVKGFFALAETALVSARRTLLQQQAEDGSRGAKSALALADSPNAFLTTVQIAVTLLGLAAGAFGAVEIARSLTQVFDTVAWISPAAAPLSFVVVFLGIVLFWLIAGELVPKRIALSHPEPIAASVAPLVQKASAVASPIVFLLNVSANGILGLLGVKSIDELPVTEEQVKLMIEHGTKVGVFEPTEQEMVERVFLLGDRSVSTLMTPRPDVVWLDPSDSVEEIQRKLTAGSHSHYPVAEGQIDNIIGMVNAKDLLSQNLSCTPIDLKAVLRPVIFVPETMPALDALERFKETRSRVAFVIDEHGGFQGLVTTSDLLEAIVGDIPMMDEEEGHEAVQREDGSWLVDGKIPAEDLKEILKVDSLPLEEKRLYQTLGGLVMACLGRVPAVGDHFEWRGLKFEVMDMDGPRVDKVMITPSAQPGPPPSP
jgi:putative hemolysin